MKKIFVLLLVILFSNPVLAIQEEKKISLKEAIKIALKTNPAINLAKLDSDIARNNVSSANRIQNPNIHFFQNIPKAGVGNPQQIGADYVLEILKRGKRKEAAEIYTLAAVDNEKFMEYRLEAEIKKSYINFLVKKSHLGIIQEQEEITKKIYESAKKMPKSEKSLKPKQFKQKLPLTEQLCIQTSQNRKS